MAKAKLGKIKPTYDNILVSFSVMDKTKGGIFIPKNTQHNENRTCGTVLACGPDCRLVKNGDKILFGVYAGWEMKQQDLILFEAEGPAADEVWKILKELDVVARIV